MKHRLEQCAVRFVVVAVAACASRGDAAVRTFTIDRTRSALTLTPTTTVFGTPLPTSRQINPAFPSADSFVTSYSGSIVADVTDGSIRLLAASRLYANYDHGWLPGTDFSNYPGDLDSPTGYTHTYKNAAYGVITDLTALGQVNGTQGRSPSAIRNLVFGLSDANAKPLGVGGTFAEAGTATSLVWDHALPEAPPLVYYGSGGSPPTTRVDTVTPGPTQDAPGTASLAVVNGVPTLTLPVSITIAYPVNFLLLTQRFEGTIVATTRPPSAAADTRLLPNTSRVTVFGPTLAIVPEPATPLLTISAALTIVRRRRRSTERSPPASLFTRERKLMSKLKNESPLRRSLPRLAAAVAAATTMVAASVDAGTVRIVGIADGDTAYYEQPSDAFFRMDLYDPPPRQTQQRFHAISNPAITFGSLAFDGFPNDDRFRLGSLTYNDAALVGGTGVAPVTGLTLGVGTDPSDSSYINYGRFAPLTTSVSNVVGAVTVVNGVATSINLTSTLTIAIGPLAGAQATGTFTITGNRFDGYAATPSTGPNTQYIYDFQGTLTTLPEPATLAAIGAAGLTAVRRRRHAVQEQA